MAKNQCSSTYEGRHQTIELASVNSGDMVLVEDDGLHGVALIDTNAQGNVVIDTLGRWHLVVESGATIAVGDALYLNQTGGTLDNLVTHGTFFGYALEAVTTAQTGDTICVLVVQDHVIQDGELSGSEIADGGIEADKLDSSVQRRTMSFGPFDIAGTTGFNCYFNEAATIVGITAVVTEGLSANETAVTVADSVPETMATITVDSGASAGDVFSAAPDPIVDNNSIAQGSYLTLTSDGSPSTGEIIVNIFYNVVTPA